MSEERTASPIPDRAPLPAAARAYACAVMAVGSVPLALSAAAVAASPDLKWVWLALVIALSSFLSIRVPTVRTTVTVCDGLAFASALLFGPAAATISVVLDGLVVSLRAHQRSVHRLLFNVGEPAISVWLAAHAYYLLARGPLEPGGSVWSLTVPIVAMTTTYFVLNTALTAIAVFLETGERPTRFLRGHVPHLALNYFASAFLLVLLIPNSSNLAAATLAVTVPLLGVSYVSAKLSLERIDDANTHLTQLNRLYLSVVETLAVAIDAKDKVTHGHIRRVQTHAVALARVLGVRDEAQVRAIEAAGLLHDVGKLVVPEHILNKPSALTPAERVQMEAHVKVGAAILSTVDFPYPVVPIVRHHHEAWDGSGYPDGLRGEEIPVGARILAVVDCFDALTSDRPYRRRMSDEEAHAIIACRRGKQYDPAVVDAFLRLYPELSSDRVEEAGSAVLTDMLAARRPLAAPTGLPQPRRSLTDLDVPARNAAAALVSDAAMQRIAPSMDALVRRIAPEAFWVLYLGDPTTGELVAVHVSSAAHAGLQGFRMRVGEGVSGWVAANEEVVANADATLDLGDKASLVEPRLRLCVSIPLASAAGVVTVYTFEPRGFSTEHARLLEAGVREISCDRPELGTPESPSAGPRRLPSLDSVLPLRSGDVSRAH